MAKESLGVSLSKLILTVTIMVSVGAMLGAAGYLIKNKATKIIQPQISFVPTLAPTLTVKDKTADWKTCKNEKYGYEIEYPLDWKVWQPGAPEARLVNCNENLSLIAFSPNIYAYPNQRQINIDVYDQNRLKGTIWKGIASLDDYLKKTPVKIKKETIIDGERLIWRDTSNNQLIAFHNGSIYYFSVYNIDDFLLDQILSTFKFIDINGSVAKPLK